MGTNMDKDDAYVLEAEAANDDVGATEEVSS